MITVNNDTLQNAHAEISQVTHRQAETRRRRAPFRGFALQGRKDGENRRPGGHDREVEDALRYTQPPREKGIAEDRRTASPEKIIQLLFVAARILAPPGPIG